MRLSAHTAAMPVPALAPRAARPRRWVEVVSHLDPRHGGLSAAVPELARSVATAEPLRVQAEIAAFCAPEEHFHPEGFRDEQLSFWPVSRRAWISDLFSGRPLHQRFREQLQHVDGIHIHGLWEQSTALAAAAARSLGVPYIVSAHGMLEPWALENRRVKKLLYAQMVEQKNVREAHALHALTRAEAGHFRRFGAIAPIAVIPNGVTCPAHSTPELFLTRFPELKDKRIFLFLGRLHVKKGLEPLVDIWSGITKHHPGAHLVIAGPDFDGTQTRLEQQISEQALEHCALLTGMLRGPMKWSALSAAEVFLLPSFSEGLSVGALEAMGMGLPVLVTKPCNMPEVTQFGAGWEIEPEPLALALALREALEQSPRQNAAIGARGTALVRERYTWPVVGRQMAEFYRWATGGPQPTSFELMPSA